MNASGQRQPNSLFRKKEYSPRYVVEISRRLRKEMTPAECMLWERIAGKQLGGFRFRRQHPIGRYVADFCCFKARVVVEVDGEVHRKQQEYDRNRDDSLCARGYAVVRFTNAEVMNQMDSVLRRILDACSKNKASPPSGDLGGIESASPGRSDFMAPCTTDEY